MIKNISRAVWSYRVKTSSRSVIPMPVSRRMGVHPALHRLYWALQRRLLMQAHPDQMIKGLCLQGKGVLKFAKTSHTYIELRQRTESTIHGQTTSRLTIAVRASATQRVAVTDTITSDSAALAILLPPTQWSSDINIAGHGRYPGPPTKDT